MKYLIVSLWCYPFGGGESFLLQTMKWAKNIGMNCFWISFCSVSSNNSITSNSNNSFDKDFDKLYIENYFYGTIIKIPGGFNTDNLYNWVKIIKPDIVHTQGHRRFEIIETISKLRIPILSGYHFWSGLIDLHPKTFNSNILENIKSHKRDGEFIKINNNSFVTSYVCSDFMKDVVNTIYNSDLPVMYASSNKDDIYVKINPCKNKFITQVNIHKLKGGEIFHHLLENTKFPYIGIKTEPNSGDLDSKITDVIKIRNNESIILDHTSNIKNIYKVTRILLVPSIVDETFCRVINEGMMNGIPIITTGAGNIKYLVGESAIILSQNPTEWIDTINKLYNNKKKLLELSEKSKKQYELFSENVASSQFKMFINSSIKSSKYNNIMLFIPFCDQGLGIQGRHYLNVLKDKYQVFIFSYHPYNSDKIDDLQVNKEEWKYDKIYYSKNTRENVKDDEITSFVLKYNIGKCIIPETCWNRVFEITLILKKLNVLTYAIPNIEIVRKDEIYKHRYFDKILCNNLLCQKHFINFGFKNTSLIGYSLEQKKRVNKIDNNSIKFLCIGGMNAFSRKQVLEICESFVNACSRYKDKKNIELTVCIQKFYNDKINKYKKYQNIRIIFKYLSFNEIQDLYENCDIFIQVSKKEGLGLGFYEAISNGIPVLTLNTPPHNEIIQEGINGWTVSCKYEKMFDNPESLIDDAVVDIELLSEKMLEIINIEDLSEIKRNTFEDYKSRFSFKNFKNIIIKNLE